MERNRRTQRLAVATTWIDAGGSGYSLAGGRALAAARAMPGNRGDEEHLARLARTIDVEIIPRLVLSRRSIPRYPVAPSPAEHHPGSDEIAEFTEIILRDTDVAAAAYIDGLRAQGTSIESLLIELLAPTARRLGDLWQADLCDFTEVMLGTLRLQTTLRSLGTAFRDEVPARDIGRRALLIPLPGDPHSFGLMIVAEYFRRAGWDVWSGPLATIDDLTGLVHHEAFDMIGLSVGCESRLDALSAGIHAVRRTSRNRNIGVMVGGPVFNDHPELVSLVGADVTASTGRQAVTQAHGLLSMLGSNE